eukprot:CAMPEP_0117451094 /NCGR_PEP_ID=MMETSP0759-20121206/8820_1 /TAXON_ID=63605 /ORGANISM="Percolomonas cosmopolitus, Strain WS" /LENGTH=524 /DNA_ID=CAMNT_0005243663 /DNA_START=447 /DNA_END=2022 /DNA_ORIENTATION=-
MCRKEFDLSSDSEEDNVDEELPSLLNHLRKDYGDNKSLEEAFQTQVNRLNQMNAHNFKGVSPPMDNTFTRHPQTPVSTTSTTSNTSTRSAPTACNATNGGAMTPGGATATSQNMPMASTVMSRTTSGRSAYECSPHMSMQSTSLTQHSGAEDQTLSFFSTHTSHTPLPRNSEYLPPPEFFDFFDGHHQHMTAGFPQQSQAPSSSNKVQFPFQTMFPSAGLSPKDTIPSNGHNSHNGYHNGSAKSPSQEPSFQFENLSPMPNISPQPNTTSNHSNDDMISSQPYSNGNSCENMDSFSDCDTAHIQRLLRSLGVRAHQGDITVAVGAQQVIDLAQKVKDLTHQLSLSRNNPFTQHFVSNTPVSMLSFHMSTTFTERLSPHPVLLTCNSAFLKMLNKNNLGEVTSRPLESYSIFGRYIPDTSLFALIYSVNSLFATLVKSGSRKVLIMQQVYRESFLMHQGVMYASYESIPASEGIDDEFTLNGQVFSKTFSTNLRNGQALSRDEVVRWIQKYQLSLSQLSLIHERE